MSLRIPRLERPQLKYSAILSSISTGLTRKVDIRPLHVTRHSDSESNPGGSVHADLATFVADLKVRGSDKIKYSTSNHYANMLSLHDELVVRIGENEDAGAFHLNVDLDVPLALIHRPDPVKPWQWIRIDAGSAVLTANVYRVEIAPAVYQALSIEFV